MNIHGHSVPGPAAAALGPGLGPGPRGPCADALAFAKDPLAAPAAMYFYKKGIEITQNTYNLGSVFFSELFSEFLNDSSKS